MVEWEPPPPVRPAIAAAARGRARRVARSCERCARAPENSVLASIRTDGRVAVEGRRTALAGVDPHSAGGKLIRALLASVGYEEVLFLSPQETPCVPCLELQLEAAKASGYHHVLLVGAKVSTQWRPDIQLPFGHGAIGVWPARGVLVMPCVHPNAALRTREWRGVIRMALAHWVTVTESTAEFNGAVRPTPLDHLNPYCLRCSRPADIYDTCGIGWCDTHVPDLSPPPPPKKKRRGKKAPGVGQMDVEGGEHGPEPADGPKPASGLGHWNDSL